MLYRRERYTSGDLFARWPAAAAGAPRQLHGKRTQGRAGLAIEHLDPICTRVGNVHPPSDPVDVRVVKTGLGA